MNRDNSNLTDEEITVDTLQDLLIYDDMFLDYFNDFLKLPVFPQALEYHRLTDSFDIVENEAESVVTCDSRPLFMANDEEHNRLLAWAQKYRLPLFLKTNLFRELKLAKLLMRPLEQFPLESRNTFIRGYSKRSDFSSLTSTRSSNEGSELTTESTENSEGEEENSVASTNRVMSDKIKLDYNMMSTTDDYIPYDTYIRPGSEAVSLPIQIAIEKTKRDVDGNKRVKGSKAKNGVTVKSNEASFVEESRQKSMTFDYTDNDSLFYRIQSAPLQYDFADLDIAYTNKVLYAKHQALNLGSADEDDEDKITNELYALEKRQKISLYRLKGLTVGTRLGMLEFKKFLRNTAGTYLCDFWLECEQFKHSSRGRSEKENFDLMNKLMRNLQDKYNLSLTKLAKEQLNNALKNPDTITVLFLQSQYDSLRRLRSYWLPRYLLHQESILRQYTLSDLNLIRLPTQLEDNASIKSGIFQRLAVEKVLPCDVTSSDLGPYSWKQINKTRNSKMTEPIFVNNNGDKERSTYSGGILKRSVFQNRLRQALAIDNESGNPFRNYLQSFNLLVQIHNLEFFQEVEKFRSLTQRNANRLLRLSHAWSIVNRFMASSGKENIGLNDCDTKDVIERVKVSKLTVKDDIFDSVIENSIKKLEQEWLRYVKEDMKKFMESSLTRRDSHSPPHSLDEIEVMIEGETIVVRRKLSVKEARVRARTWDTLSKEERQRRREKALELNRITEIERQKVLKAVALRIRIQQEEEKRLKSMMSMMTLTKAAHTNVDETDELDDSKEGTTLSGDQTDISFEDRTPDMKRTLENKVLFNLFKKYVIDHSETSAKDCQNALMLLQDVYGYFELHGIDRATLQKKDHKSNSIYKGYLDKACKKPVPLNDSIRLRLVTDKMRPKSPTLREIQAFTCHNLVEIFREFWKYETKELGVKSNVLSAMSEIEIEKLAENQLNEINKNSKTKNINTAAITKEDKNEFLLALSDAAYGQLSLQMLHFYRYLVERGPEDKVNNLDKDLFFYVEVLKLKEMCRTTVEEEIAKKKVQCISATFLESVYPPAVQINVSNEIAQRAIRAVQRQLTCKDVNITIFDECCSSCLKTLLPYWAGFQRQWQETEDRLYRPVSKIQRILERRKQMYNDIPIPKAEVVTLPVIPKGTNLSTLSYTMNDGAKWKEPQDQTQIDTNNTHTNGANSDINQNRKRSLIKKVSKGMAMAAVAQT